MAASDATAFFPGERLVFELRWGIIPAGEATLSVSSVKDKQAPAYRFVMTARTTPFIDLFYKVRNHIESHTDKEITRSLFYQKYQQEGQTRKNVTVQFDWRRMQADYYDDHSHKRSVELMPGTFDPLSAFYYVRSVAVGDQKWIERPVTDGKKRVVGRARVIARETVTVPMGTFDTYVMEPELKHVGGVFKKSKGARILVWVTADHRQLPVRLESQVAIGSFVGELVAANGRIPARQEDTNQLVEGHNITVGMASP